MLKQDIRGYAEDTLGGKVNARGTWVNADCVECGRPNHMGVNTKTGVAHCFGCGYSVSLISLLQAVDGLRYDIALRRSIELLAGIGTSKRPKKMEALYAVLRGAMQKQNVSQQAALKLPKNCVPITSRDAKPAMCYLRGRGFKLSHVLSFNLQYVAERDDNEPRFWKHIVFPVYAENGTLQYWTTRAAYESKKPFPKSYHPQGVRKETLFGIDTIPQRRAWCVLVEGPLDAVALPRMAVAILGKNLTGEQVHVLVKRFAEIIVCLDADASTDAINAAETLHRCGVPHVRVATCPWDDPACSTRAAESASAAAMQIVRSSTRFTQRLRMLR